MAAADYSDEKLLGFTLNDPDIEDYRNFVRNERRGARQQFMAAHALVTEWETESLDAANDALSAERKARLAAAQQNKENLRAKFAEWDRIYQSFPEPAKKSATGAVAREASKP